ncbi:hypothetical protein KJS94_15055 [Flavihumibacter rivuli]|uniref:hypothetical protein n=1 Tax=Flavihumibacter rivuli TaxID=2838156 RepID=UPI001BDE6F8C|nr:hypothetical protein [Flavihumibacter rivuli]ULQ55967.1 hypothetical protein KJS94_15055 [Flavihumibacter rivuli]
MKIEMKPLRILLRFAVFITVAFFVFNYFFSTLNKVEEENEIYLNNDVQFGGIVKSLKVSNNHRFGIITLSVVENQSTIFNQNSSDDRSMLFPYSLENDFAEIYEYVPSGLSVGDSIYLNSKERLIKYFYTKENKQFKGRLKMITDGFDIDFVNQNSQLKLLIKK